jgi:hypothetical protein
VAEPPRDRDRLRQLTERLDIAAQRAERLLSDSVLAAATAAPSDRSGPDRPPPPPPLDRPPSDRDPTRLRPADAGPVSQRPPPSGWQRPADDPTDRDRWLDSDELELLLTVLAAVRDRIPADLRGRLAEAVRELLMALRAVIDWYLERTEHAAQPSANVEDIPIL